LRHQKSAKLKVVYARALNRLRDKNYLINPFKFMVYSELGNEGLQAFGGEQ